MFGLFSCGLGLLAMMVLSVRIEPSSSCRAAMRVSASLMSFSPAQIAFHFA
ncbi:hypothetical protein [Mesorhizobium sp. M0208]|uniref:hypothetical protein n=1 Tax=Mesorhizobium sp. M0208 TaxID=2956916 RepID=UPI00333D0300